MPYPAYIHCFTTITSKPYTRLRFFSLTQAVIDLNKNLVTFYNELLAVPIKTHNREHNFLVTSNYTVLPPLSETIVLVNTLRPVRTNCVALVEPLPHASKTKFWVARHITILHTSHTFCRVYNPHNNPIWIGRYTRLATLEYVHNDHIVKSLNTQTSVQPCTNSQRHMTTLDDIGIQLTNDNLTPDER